MSKAGIIVLLGFIMVLLPFIGIPSVAKSVVAIVIGIFLMALGLLVREERRWLMRALSGDKTDAYTENSQAGYQHLHEEVVHRAS